VQGIVHSFGATRCIILHLVTSQSLQHAAGNADVPLVVYSLVIAIVALFCIQVRSPCGPGSRLAGARFCWRRATSRSAGALRGRAGAGGAPTGPPPARRSRP